MRTLIDLSEQHLDALTRLAKQRRVSRAQLVREAVAGYLEHAPELRARRDWIADGFGALSDTPLRRDDKRYADSLEYERALRGEWAGTALVAHRPAPARGKR